MSDSDAGHAVDPTPGCNQGVMAFCSEILKPSGCRLCSDVEKVETGPAVEKDVRHATEPPSGLDVHQRQAEQDLRDLAAGMRGPAAAHLSADPVGPMAQPQALPEGQDHQPSKNMDTKSESGANVSHQKVSVGFMAALRGGNAAADIEGGGNCDWQHDIVVQEPYLDYTSEPAEEPGMLGDGEEEAEEEDTHNPRRELIRMLLFCLTVFAVIAGYLVSMIMTNASYDSGRVCDKEVPYEVCSVCGKAVFLPVGGDWENSWEKLPRAPMYFFGLMWCFMGVAIVCDSFMAAIEEIASKEKVVWLQVHGGAKHKFHMRVWNATVANLTLMALGSSAPEILLSCIELVGNDFFAGELGPSTIVGSAAFNLLVITAVCVSALPNDEVRKVEMTTVFAVTAGCSLWAYLWLVVILQLVTPDKIDIMEGVLTFAMFPLLVFVAFIADKGYFDTMCKTRGKVTDCAVEEMVNKLSIKYGKSITMDTAKVFLEMASLTKKKPMMSKSEARRVFVARLLGGATGKGDITFGFKDRLYPVLECVGSASVTVTASRMPGCAVQMRYTTRDAGAKAGAKYRHTEGILTFDRKDTEKTISIPIIDDDTGGESKTEFLVVLSDLQFAMSRNASDTVRPAAKLQFSNKSTRVVIIDDDDAGTLGFSTDEVMAVKDAQSVTVHVTRANGTCGNVTVQYETMNPTHQDLDYDPVSGTLHFAPGESRKAIEVPLHKKQVREEEQTFRIALRNATGGARFDATTDGGETSAICEVILPGRGSGKGGGGLSRACCGSSTARGMQEWREQFLSAVYVGGGPEEQSKAGISEYIFHAVALFWKVLFAFVPPANLCGGWLCFFVALGMVGSVTALIADMANMLGCSLGLSNDITAITLVALGTSLPDTFASKAAAQHDDCADNSVGNVTGSNSVNVFLGLGLPWTIGAIYWSQAGVTTAWLERDYKGKTYEALFHDTYRGGGFLVPAGSLGFSVSVFVAAASVCLGMLILRRRLYGGELGGPASAARRDAVIMVCLWLVYITASIVQSTTSK